MNDLQACAHCGTEQPAGALQGLCPACLARISLALPAPETLSQGSLEPGAIPPRDAGTSAARVRYFGDYEILGEIASGGMGVVLRARQTSLNREVALKMIRSGVLASETEIRRFQAEAEAAARLRHPNIVSIHEIGEHEGCHYFSMELVAGPNLAAHLRSHPMSIAEAARLVSVLAEAVDYAHQRGVLHRDLKPQNILIDPQGEPRLTDFGLAKYAQRDTGLTLTGVGMGTPSYLPPEQASGHWNQVGPASDVYSLGAVLYEMLTGRPPFKGANAMETVILVTTSAATPASRLNPRIPADLNTICLKCLEKDPSRRYPSARALADDLTRFLNHETIQARPANPLRRGWNWMLRHPWMVTAGLALLLLGLVGFAYSLWEQNRLLRWQALHPLGTAPLPLAPDQRLFSYERLRGFMGAWTFFLWALISPPSALLSLDRHRRQGRPAGWGHYLFYAVAGLNWLGSGLWLAAGWIHEAVWGLTPSPARDLWYAGLTTYLLCWPSLYLAWRCVGEYCGHQAGAAWTVPGPIAPTPPAAQNEPADDGPGRWVFAWTPFTSYVALFFATRAWSQALYWGQPEARGLWLLPFCAGLAPYAGFAAFRATGVQRQLWLLGLALAGLFLSHAFLEANPTLPLWERFGAGALSGVLLGASVAWTEFRLNRPPPTGGAATEAP